MSLDIGNEHITACVCVCVGSWGGAGGRGELVQRIHALPRIRRLSKGRCAYLSVSSVNEMVRDVTNAWLSARW